MNCFIFGFFIVKIWILFVTDVTNCCLINKNFLFIGKVQKKKKKKENHFHSNKLFFFSSIKIIKATKLIIIFKVLVLENRKIIIMTCAIKLISPNSIRVYRKNP